MIDDDPMTDNRREALRSLEPIGRVDQTQLIAIAQVHATLDLADATREQTEALEAISAGWRLTR